MELVFNTTGCFSVVFFINITLTGVFYHSSVCFWSQEIEKRSICRSPTLILEIFRVKLYILYL